MWRPQVDIRCVLSIAPHLTDAGSLTKPDVIASLPKGPFVYASSMLRLQVAAISTWPLCGFWGSEPRSTHFKRTYKALPLLSTSQAPLLSFLRLALLCVCEIDLLSRTQDQLIHEFSFFSSVSPSSPLYWITSISLQMCLCFLFLKQQNKQNTTPDSAELRFSTKP